jgi:hypothetical protein
MRSDQKVLPKVPAAPAGVVVCPFNPVKQASKSWCAHKSRIIENLRPGKCGDCPSEYKLCEECIQIDPKPLAVDAPGSHYCFFHMEPENRGRRLLVPEVDRLQASDPTAKQRSMIGQHAAFMGKLARTKPRTAAKK